MIQTCTVLNEEQQKFSLEDMSSCTLGFFSNHTFSSVSWPRPFTLSHFSKSDFSTTTARQSLPSDCLFLCCCRLSFQCHISATPCHSPPVCITTSELIRSPPRHYTHPDLPLGCSFFLCSSVFTVVHTTWALLSISFSGLKRNCAHTLFSVQSRGHYPHFGCTQFCFYVIMR